jgi:hypothetical protein
VFERITSGQIILRRTCPPDPNMAIRDLQGGDDLSWIQQELNRWNRVTRAERNYRFETHGVGETEFFGME